MAEALTEEGVSKIFYCCRCHIRFENVASNVTCPNCFGNLIEDLGISTTWRDAASFQVFPQNSEHYAWRSERFDAIVRQIVNAAEDVGPPPARRNYTWRRERFDAVVRQIRDYAEDGGLPPALRNYSRRRERFDAMVRQIEITHPEEDAGPPPAPDKVIDDLPIISISLDQVNANLQCSICLENFYFSENVRMLPCSHIYHAKCIKHWLELHATCPICRQSIINE